MFYKLRFTVVSELIIGILLTDHVLEDLQVKHGDQNDFYKYSGTFLGHSGMVLNKFYIILFDKIF